MTSPSSGGGGQFLRSGEHVLTAIVAVGLALVLVAKDSQTARIAGSFWDGFNRSLRTVTGRG